MQNSALKTQRRGAQTTRCCFNRSTLFWMSARKGRLEAARGFSEASAESSAFCTYAADASLSVHCASKEKPCHQCVSQQFCTGTNPTHHIMHEAEQADSACGATCKEWRLYMD